MGMSFSGILSYFETVVEYLPHLKLPDLTTNGDTDNLERRKRKKRHERNTEIR
jgi:hypothetical protein